MPHDEAARLAELAGLELLGTPPEERFDRITRTAVAAFDVPVAFLSLVDRDRVWCKSAAGTSLVESERLGSFCGQAIRQDDALVVPDARADARFAGNVLVTGPLGIRFYAGRPLRGPAGHRVGTLCIADRVVRYLTDAEHRLLDDLGGWAERELASRALADTVDALAESERDAAELHRRFELIVDSVAEAIVGVDLGGRVTFANDAVRRVLGRAPDELVGRSLHDEHHGVHADGTPYPWPACPTYRTLTEAVHLHVRDEVYRRADGSPFPVEYTSSPVVDDGGVVGAVLCISDLSERLAAERAQEQFVSVVSHELRTPLTSLRGSLGLLASGAMGDLGVPAQRLVEVAVSSTDRLVRLVNDLLELERAAAGVLELDLRPVDLAGLVEASLDAVRAVAEAAGVRLVADVVEREVVVDPDRIVQVLVNLLGNAVKFSPPGGEACVRAEPDGDGVVLRVIDTGRGIPVEELDAVFDRFRQVERGDARDKGGTGLGLAIVRAIVEQHGGRVHAESAPGAGASFVVALPGVPVPVGSDGRV